MPVDSESRFAARPVGAAKRMLSLISSHFIPSSCSSFLSVATTPLIMVVFPVPGPPVRIKRLLIKAAIIASRCTSSYGNGFSSSTSANCFTTSARLYSLFFVLLRRTIRCAISRSASNNALMYKFCPSAMTIPSEVNVNNARLINAGSMRAF